MAENSSTNKYDYLIVGQGIAGTSLAWNLLDRQKKVLVVGSQNMPSSSKVAAGIFNPLTGKKLVKTWMADNLFPYAAEFYGNLEKKLDAKFVHQVPLYRPYRSIEEQNNYLAQTADPAIARYVSETTDPDLPLSYIENPYGGLKVIQSGWIDLPLLLEKSRIFFENLGVYVEDLFSTDDVTFFEGSVKWKDFTFDKVVLCQGAEALNNSFFNWLPFSPVKGQIMEVELENIFKSYIVNQGIFILPISEKRGRVGATYSWDPLDWNVTEEATEELKGKLNTLLNIPFKISRQQAGLRPSVKDRRPLVGVHPDHSNLVIFNGLGTKGVTLGPYFANNLVEHLEDDKELNPLVNIKRYFSLYFR